MTSCENKKKGRKIKAIYAIVSCMPCKTVVDWPCVSKQKLYLACILEYLCLHDIFIYIHFST